MAGAIHVGGDALGVYYTGHPTANTAYSPADSIGGARLAREVERFGIVVDGGIKNVAVLRAGGSVMGTGTITVADDDTLAYTGPDEETAGAQQYFDPDGDRVTHVLYSDSGDSWVRLMRTSDDPFTGEMAVKITETLHGPIAHGSIDGYTINQAGKDSYRCVCLYNHSDKPITNIKLLAYQPGTPQTTDVDQLGASGPGSLETSGSFEDWGFTTSLRHRYVAIVTNADALREIVLATSDVSDFSVLSVVASSRELYGTTAAAGTATDTAYPLSPLAWAVEAPDSDGLAQRIADEETAPSGLGAWRLDHTMGFGGNAIDLLNPGEYRYVWLWRDVPQYAQYYGRLVNYLQMQFTVDGDTHTETFTGSYQVAHDYGVLSLHIGEGAMPSLSADFATWDGWAFDHSTSFPWTEALAAPVAKTTFWCIVRRRSPYFTQSQNTFPTKITVNPDGSLWDTGVTPPDEVDLSQLGAGRIQITARYVTAWDDDPADTFVLYYSTDGVDPVPDAGNTTEEEVEFIPAPLSTTGMLCDHVLGPYDYGTDLRVLVRAKRSSDDVESPNETASQVTVETGEPYFSVPISIHQGDRMEAASDPQMANTLYYDDGELVKTVQMPGECRFISNDRLIWRAVASLDGTPARLYIDPDFDLVNTDVYAAATIAGGVEVVDADTIYLVANSKRIVKIDLSAYEISCDTFYQDASVEQPEVRPRVPFYHDASEGILQCQAYSMDNTEHLCYALVDEANNRVTLLSDLVQRIG